MSPAWPTLFMARASVDIALPISENSVLVKKDHTLLIHDSLFYISYLLKVAPIPMICGNEVAFGTWRKSGQLSHLVSIYLSL